MSHSGKISTVHRRGRQLLYIAGDLLSGACIWLCFLFFRWSQEGDSRLSTLTTGLVEAMQISRGMIVYSGFCLLVYYLSGYYMQPNRRRVGSELVTTLLSAIFISLIAFFYIIIDDHVADYRGYYTYLLGLVCLQFVISYLVRVLISVLTRAYHYHPQTYTLRLGEEQGDICLPSGTERVLIEVPKGSDEQHLYRLINKLYPKRVEIAFTARTYDMLMGRTRIKSFEEAPMVCITDMPMSDFQLTLKRTFDIVVSALGLVVLSPLLVGLGIAIQLDSPGPVLYKQERIGHYGRPFKILKFRTMSKDAETDGPQLTQDSDPRITRIGGLLRKYRLDELPQLWNILKGDMSVVGPRPERAHFIRQIEEKAPYYCLIYKMRPGLTSWGPIKVGYTDTVEMMVERLGYDIAYMENMSLMLDVKILFYTIGVVIHGKGR